MVLFLFFTALTAAQLNESVETRETYQSQNNNTKKNNSHNRNHVTDVKEIDSHVKGHRHSDITSVSAMEVNDGHISINESHISNRDSHTGNGESYIGNCVRHENAITEHSMVNSDDTGDGHAFAVDQQQKEKTIGAVNTKKFPHLR